MKYIVMECHLSYAVVLDEDGRFLNVANMHYEVGQTVTDIIEMHSPQEEALPAKRFNRKWIYSLATIAACLVLVFTAALQSNATPFASVYMTINPEVRIDVNRKDVVVGLDGINDDGEQLISDYNYKKKDLDLVMDELVDRAIDMGYLHEGGQITLTLDADDNEWVVTKSDALSNHLNKHLEEKLSVTIEVTNSPSKHYEVVIPVNPDTNTTNNTYSESDYEDSTTSDSSSPPSTGASGESSYDDGQTDYGSTSDDDGQSNYSTPQVDDGQSNYSAPEVDDGQSNYEAPENEDGQSNYSSSDDGQSAYEENDD